MEEEFSSNKVSCGSLLKLKDGFYDILKIDKVSDNSFPFILVNDDGAVKKVSMNRKLVADYEELKI
jgi:hypothetical protein